MLKAEVGEQEGLKDGAVGARRGQSMNSLELHLKKFGPLFGDEEELVNGF